MTDFQNKIRSILAGDFEFTEEEKETIRKIWMTDEDYIQDQVNKGYEKQKERMLQDELFRKWRKLYNGLNVTLNRLRKRGQETSPSVIRYIEELENLVNEGFDPDSVRKTKVDWHETFKAKKVIYREMTEKSKSNNKWLMRKCVYEGEELTLNALRCRFKKTGRDPKDAAKYLRELP